MTARYSEEFMELLAELGAAESPELEFKEASGGLPQSLWETLCAFANTSGGVVVLGVREYDGDLEVTGVPHARQRVDDLFSQARNQNKISKDVLSAGGVTIAVVDGRELIVVRVRPADRRIRPIYIRGQAYGGTYLRRSTGDYVASTDEVNRMMREASDLSADLVILRGYGINDLDSAAVATYRRLLVAHEPGSPLAEFDEMAFLLHIEAYRRDRQTDDEGLTVAGLLMFGKDEAIRDWRGRHLLDARLLPTGAGASEPDWADRVVWEGHLFGAYRRIDRWLTQDLPVPFRLEQGRRVEDSPRHVALREALVNLLVHADYSERGASLILRWDGGVRFRNPGSSRIPQPGLHGENHSDPRNPALVRMFRRIGFAEEAGTGIPRLIRAWREVGYEPPEIDPGTDQYEFSITLPYTHWLADEDRDWLEQFGASFTEAEQLALVIARQGDGVDNQAVRAVTGAHGADVSRVLTGLRDRGYLEMVGSKRGARYFLAPTSLVDSSLSLVDNDLSLVDSGLSLGDNRTNIGDSGPSIGVGVGSLGSRRQPQAEWTPRDETAQAVLLLQRGKHRVAESIVQLCSIEPLSVQQMAGLLGRDRDYVRKAVTSLVKSGKIRPVYAEAHHPKQAYTAPRQARELTK